MYLAVVLSVAAFAGCPLGARSASSPIPRSSPTPLPMAVVNNLCVDYDLHLDGYVYYEGYLFCEKSDENTEGQALFKETAPGRVTFLRGGGGADRAKDLVKLAHVPPHIARVLVERLRQAVDAGHP